MRLWLAKRAGIHKVQHRFSDILDLKIMTQYIVAISVNSYYF